MTGQLFPDSQKEPLGPEQIKYINAVYGRAFFRQPRPMIEPTHCNCRYADQTREP